MEPDQIRAVSCDDVELGKNPGGTGAEETFRNLMLQEIAAQLSEITGFLQRIAFAVEHK